MSRTEVGARYCVTHDGIANDDDSVCDFAHDENGECDYRQLFYEDDRG